MLVAVKVRRAVVRSYQDIEVAVAIKIAISQTAADFRSIKSSAGFARDILKFSAALIQKKLRGLRVANISAYVADGFVDVPVGDRQVELAVQVDIEKKTPEAQCIFGRRANSCEGRNVIVHSRFRGAIQADHLVVKIGDGDSGLAGVFKIPDVHAHPSARFAFGAEGQPGLHGYVSEFSVMKIAVKLVGLGVVGDEQVGPAILVVVQHGHTERFRTAVEDAAGGCYVFEPAVAAIVEQPAGIAAIGFGRAIRFVCAIEAAKHVVFGRPAHVVADEQIQQAITVVVEPQRRSAETLTPEEAARTRDVHESSLAGVAEEPALPDASDKNIGEAIVVVVAGGDAHSVQLEIQPGFLGHVGECAVAIVPVKLQRRTLALMSRPIHAVHEQNVLPAVRVVVEEGASRAESFRKQFSAVSPAVVAKMDPRRVGNVGEPKS